MIGSKWLVTHAWVCYFCMLPVSFSDFNCHVLVFNIGPLCCWKHLVPVVLDFFQSATVELKKLALNSDFNVFLTHLNIDLLNFSQGSIFLVFFGNERVGWTEKPLKSFVWLATEQVWVAGIWPIGDSVLQSLFPVLIISLFGLWIA